MKTRIFGVLIYVLVAMLSVLPASAAQTSTEQQTALEISKLINQYRAENGLYQYIYHDTLAAVAQAHTDYQVSIGESTHYGAGRSTSKDRVTASGYGAGSFIFTSEMIYAGQFATPQAALDWWKNSPIHNGIMLSEDYHEFGVGVRITEERKYYTVNVAAIKGVTGPGLGSPPVQPPQPEVSPVMVAAPNQDGSIVHVVEAGQTLQQIADAYQVSLDALLASNALVASDALSAGQSLIVRLAAPVEEASAGESGPALAAEPDEEAALVSPPAENSPSNPLQPTVPEGYMLLSNITVTALVLVALIASAGVLLFAYLRLAESNKKRR